MMKAYSIGNKQLFYSHALAEGAVFEDFLVWRMNSIQGFYSTMLDNGTWCIGVYALTSPMNIMDQLC
ncbi:hypothetical protein chiPu_0003525 [Chiloscyllium punctatum]|uniref:Uncharacterized protein n=1 Tax=Chiloscyllium punctatum TaxID=137246 RepID=A0A401S3Z2_CHIPU|nr:hypothetical protein [Chiloscyllium punctatum]